MDKLKDIPFFLPKNSNQNTNLLGVKSIFMESVELEEKLKNLESTETQFFGKSHENVRLYQNFWKQRLLLWMITLALKFSF